MIEKDLINEINELKKSNYKLKTEINQLNNEFKIIRDLNIHLNMISSNHLNYCPVCGELSSFKPFGIIPRNNALCPVCSSLERTRLAYFIFKLRYDYLFNRNIKFLHFAPETTFYNIFSKLKNIDYYPVDFSPEIYESRGINIRSKVDMENIQYEDGKFDVIFNSHVLEHVPNDIKGMKELYRVLKPDGVCFTMVPLASNLEKTFEDEKINTPELRLKYYGQDDHLRKYGLDFKNRLESVGFNVEKVKSKDIFKTTTKREFYGLTDWDAMFICTK